MGVPALFRWLSNKYPKIITSVVEEDAKEVDGEEIPVDHTKANPNGWENHNLYLDMNGIVHPCSHPEDRPPPTTEEEMMFDVFEYTDRVVNMVRPRRLLMIAVDGVAPRAKMNQQRSRRFRSAQEAKEKDDEKAEFLKMLKAQQKSGPISDETEAMMTKKTWDSNSITPGTPFMNLLAAALRYWVSWKLNTDPAWAKLKVIISDATVPGEGEHKIMEFVRSQRRSPDHDPNTNHVIYGLDADLIMLGLATHEPHFRVLREDVFLQEAKNRACRICGQTGHYADQCRGETKQKASQSDENSVAKPKKPFIWLHVSILREYLAAELSVPNQGFQFDLERALDDWVFMCFFVGNDFLPHLPSLDIREDGIDTLIAIWRDNIPLMGGYVTKDGHVDLERVQYILAGLAKQESTIFKRRKEKDDRRAEAEKRREAQRAQRRGPRRSDQNGNSQNGTPSRRPNPHAAPEYASEEFIPGEGWKKTASQNLTHDMIVNRKAAVNQANVANKSAAAILKEKMRAQNGSQESLNTVDGNGASASPSQNDVQTPPSALGKRKAADVEDSDTGTPGRNTPNSFTDSASKSKNNEPAEDTVKLWEDGYEERYYEQKFKRAPDDIEFRHQVARDYVEGLCWVLLYYMQGCPSWTWYYPHHYAPFAADFVEIAKMNVKFDKGRPFRPYEQLMGVMPAASRHTLPEAFHPLMTEADSDIIEFYPEDFVVDLNGKKFSWQGVALLPFIDEKRLLAAMDTKYPLLSQEEVARNEPGREALLFSGKHPLFAEVEEKFYSKNQGAPKYKLDPQTSEFLVGKIEKNEDVLPYSTLASPMDRSLMEVEEDRSMSVHYELPFSTNVHKSMLLRGVQLPTPVLDNQDLDSTKSRAGRTGRSFGGVPLKEGTNGHNQRGGSINYSNPFAAHLNPNFNPGVMNRAPPPPHLAAQMGFPPPPPPTMQASGAYWTGAGYNTGSQGWGYRGPPPGANGGYNQGGGYGGGRDSQRDGGHDSYRGGGNSYRGRGGGSQRDGHSQRGGADSYRSGGRDNRYDRERDQGHGYGYSGGYSNGGYRGGRR